MNTSSPIKLIWQGALAISPLSLAVIPWGILAGSYAIRIGLTGLEAQALSAILFAGAAQLVATGMFDNQVGLWAMLVTTFFITSRHFLYSVSMRDRMSPLPFRWRLLLGFLLTDELFAVCGHQKKSEFSRWYALGAGFSFYLVWNIASFIGIVAGKQLPNLEHLGLEFAVAATFIAIVIPSIKNKAILVAVIVALVTSVILSYWNIGGSLIIASVLGMVCGYLMELFMPNNVTKTSVSQTEGDQG